jgi:hypothetical protein
MSSCTESDTCSIKKPSFLRCFIERIPKSNGGNRSVPEELYASKDARTVREGGIGVAFDARLPTSQYIPLRREPFLTQIDLFIGECFF